ncbi:MAG: hypothetical protein ACKOEM_05775 [Planctomycetia bacterium]
MRRAVSARSIRVRSLCGLLAAACLVQIAGAARAAERQVLLVASVDSYADLKRQLGWFGTQIDNPGLAAMFESLLMLSTQGRGLAGLDVKRPAGIVVTSDGTDLAAHGFVPVKDLDKLLTSLQGIIGPVAKDGASRRVTLPSGITLSITDRNGWAVIAPPGLEAADPAPLLDALAKDFTVGIEAFPSRMSDAVRKQIEAALDQAAAASAAQGQPMDPGALKAALGGLKQTESLSLGLGIDDTAGEVFVENRSVALPGTVSAAAFEAAGTGTLTVGTPPPAAGERPALRGYIAQAIPEAARGQFLEALDQTLPREADDPLTRTLSRLIYDLLSATLAAGGIDAALAVDTSRATKDKPLPAVTAGVRVKDGAALERQVKQAFAGGNGAGLPGVKARFDAGKAGGATLHTISVDVADEELAARIGNSLDLTLAVAPNYALVLAGGDAAARAEAALAASGRPVDDAKPIASLRASAAPMLEYVDTLAGEGPAAKGGGAAREAGGGAVELRVAPIERGVATRLSIDSGALKAGAAMAAPERPVGPGGIPLPEVPPGFPIPLPR